MLGYAAPGRVFIVRGVIDVCWHYLLVTPLWYSMNVWPSKEMASVSPADFSYIAGWEERRWSEITQIDARHCLIKEKRETCDVWQTSCLCGLIKVKDKTVRVSKVNEVGKSSSVFCECVENIKLRSFNFVFININLDPCQFTDSVFKAIVHPKIFFFYLHCMDKKPIQVNAYRYYF